VKDLKDRIGAVAAALSLIGAIIFGAQRVAYERFYDKFGVSPEDVGIDFTRVLQQTAGGLGGQLFLVTLYMAFAWVVSLFLRGTAIGSSITVQHLLVAGLAISGCLLVVLFAANWAQADDAASCAARPDGRPVRGFRTHMPGGLLVTRLGIRADRAVLRSTDPKDPLARMWKGHRFVYLGTANGSVFVYDPRRRESALSESRRPP
jgi:hypothetical protein